MAKEHVRLRAKKLADGSQSLYLDIYDGGRRSYEFLRLYLAPETNRQAKEKNKTTMAMAEQVRAQREYDLLRGRLGVTDRKAELFAYFDQQMGKRHGKNADTWLACRKWMAKHEPNAHIRLADITSAWCEGFIALLMDNLSEGTAWTYTARLAACFNAAVREGVIARSPLAGVQRPRANHRERSFLTLEEMKKIAVVKCTTAPLERFRRAFLFACFTGLRFCDVAAITWEMVSTYQGRTRITFTQRKTKERQYLDLNDQAVAMMGAPATGRIFPLCTTPNSRKTLMAHLLQVTGITRHLTFHCARHTFAVTLLASGIDLYTVSKLLGHTNIATTQIYAKVIDASKRAAVDAFPTVTSG